MDFFTNFAQNWQEIQANPTAALLVIGNLILIESLLSVDNAAVLATMVMDLKGEERTKALRYGMWGAYAFRGLAMLFANYLIQIWWLKLIGGLYLLILVYKFYKSKQTETKDDDTLDKESNWLYKSTIGFFGQFWATVAMVEIMDMAFSVDNVFAAVAYTPNILLVCTGVFIGILAMRFVAQAFVGLMERYPFLESAAFAVIAILGVKLVGSSVVEHFFDKTHILHWLFNSETTDLIVSGLTVAIFFIPILTSRFLGFPKGKDEE